MLPPAVSPRNSCIIPARPDTSSLQQFQEEIRALHCQGRQNPASHPRNAADCGCKPGAILWHQPRGSLQSWIPKEQGTCQDHPARGCFEHLRGWINMGKGKDVVELLPFLKSGTQEHFPKPVSPLVPLKFTGAVWEQGKEWRTGQGAFAGWQLSEKKRK